MLRHVLWIMMLVPFARAQQLLDADPAEWNDDYCYFIPGQINEDPVEGMTIPKLLDELIEGGVIRTLARNVGLPDEETEQFQLFANVHEIYLYSRTRKSPLFQILSINIYTYIAGRLEGHTRELLLNTLTSPIQPGGDSSLGALAVVNKYPFFPRSKLRLLDQGVATNAAGTTAYKLVEYTQPNGQRAERMQAYTPETDEHWRWELYKLTDGPRTWTYKVNFKPDESLNYIERTRSE